MFISCRMRTTSHQTQILLTASRSCTYLETMKQCSRWSWTMTHVSRTHRVALDCFLTESISTSRSKSNILTPNTNSLTCWPKEISRVMRLCRVQATKATSPKQNYMMMHVQHLNQRSSFMLFPGNLFGPRVLHTFGAETRHHCIFYGPNATSSIQGSSVLFLNAWSCLFQLKRSFQASKKLSPRAQTSSPRGAWVETDPHATLVDIWSMFKKTSPIFAKHRKVDMIHLLRQAASTKVHPFFSLVQKRLSIQNWNPGPRRGKEDALQKQIAGRWHVITLQEASEYVDHDIQTGRFHVTHYGGCAILFNKDTFHSTSHVKSIDFHDTRWDLPDQVMEGEQGWVMQGILSRASFRRPTLSGQETFTVLSLHISHFDAKKRGIAKKLILTIRAFMTGQQIDVVAGDFHGTAWRCSNRNNISTIDEAFAECIANAAVPCTTDGTRFDYKQLGRRATGFRWLLYKASIPFLAKLFVFAQTIKVAIIRHGSTGISSSGAALNRSMMSMTDEFSSKNVLQRVHTGIKNVSAKSWATIRSLHERATLAGTLHGITHHEHHFMA